MCVWTVSKGLQCRDSSVTKIFARWSGLLQILGNSGVCNMHIDICIFLEREREIQSIYYLGRTPNKHISRRMCFTFHVECVLLFSALTEQEMMCEKAFKNRMKKSRRHCKTNMAYYDSFVCPGVHPTSYYIFSQLFFRTQAKTMDSVFPKFQVASYLNKPLRKISQLTIDHIHSVALKPGGLVAKPPVIACKSFSAIGLGDLAELISWMSYNSWFLWLVSNMFF